ncbi:MAG TPA: IS1595 family transposase [Parvularculaceae bacterium]|nr:IS1595 family transposase [Parvularculaceae bacterium]
MAKTQKQPTYQDFLREFPDDDACLEHLMRVRYGDRHECVGCGKSAHYYRAKKRQAYACEYCGYQVYPKAGTPFEKSRTSLHSWFFAMFLFCASRNGVSAKEIERQIGVTYKTAWRMARLIREYMTDVDGDAPLGGPGGKIVEADKAFIGGVDKGSRGPVGDKSIVLGMVERDGEILTWVIPHRGRKAVRPIIQSFVKEGTHINTDEARAFMNLDDFGYRHSTVNHAKDEYVRGDVHTNTIEGFWGLFKGAYRGTYVHLSEKYLPLYLGEFEYRWNLRKQPHLMFPILLQAFSRPERRTPSVSEAGQSVA